MFKWKIRNKKWWTCLVFVYSFCFRRLSNQCYHFQNYLIFRGLDMVDNEIMLKSLQDRHENRFRKSFFPEIFRTFTLILYPDKEGIVKWWRRFSASGKQHEYTSPQIIHLLCFLIKTFYNFIENITITCHEKIIAFEFPSEAIDTKSTYFHCTITCVIIW